MAARKTSPTAWKWSSLTYLRCEYVTVCLGLLIIMLCAPWVIRETPFLLQPLAVTYYVTPWQRTDQKINWKGNLCSLAVHGENRNLLCKHRGVHVIMGEGLNILSFISAAVIEDCDWKQLKGAKDLFHLVGHRPTLREFETGPQAGLGSRSSRGMLLVGSLTDSCFHLFFFLIFRTRRFYFYLEKKNYSVKCTDDNRAQLICCVNYKHEFRKGNK